MPYARAITKVERLDEMDGPQLDKVGAALGRKLRAMQARGDERKRAKSAGDGASAAENAA